MARCDRAAEVSHEVIACCDFLVASSGYFSNPVADGWVPVNLEICNLERPAVRVTQKRDDIQVWSPYQ